MYDFPSLISLYRGPIIVWILSHSAWQLDVTLGWSVCPLGSRCLMLTPAFGYSYTLLFVCVVLSLSIPANPNELALEPWTELWTWSDLMKAASDRCADRWVNKGMRGVNNVWSLSFFFCCDMHKRESKGDGEVNMVVLYWKQQCVEFQHIEMLKLHYVVFGRKFEPLKSQSRVLWSVCVWYSISLEVN